MQKIISAHDGSHIFYKTIGHGPALFFIHGNSGSHHYFRRQVLFFKKYYQLILMDTRDHGRSTNKQDHLSFEEIISDMNVILRHEKINHVSLFGFSDGANIALTFASKFQEKVNKLILISPNITFGQLKPSQQFISNRLTWVARHIIHSKRLTRVTQLARENIPVSIGALTNLRVPTLVVIGDRDIVTPESMETFVKNLPFGKMVVIDNCGHSIPKLKTKELNTLTFDFLNEHQLGL